MGDSPKKKETATLKEGRKEIPLLDSAESARRRRATEHRRIRKVSPLGMRVLVEIRREQNVSEGGLYLPEGAKSQMAESVLAEVIEVASAVDHSTDEEANISGVPMGALVLISKNSGTRVPWDDQLRIVETKEILALVHEIEMI